METKFKNPKAIFEIEFYFNSEEMNEIQEHIKQNSLKCSIYKVLTHAIHQMDSEILVLKIVSKEEDDRHIFTISCETTDDHVGRFIFREEPIVPYFNISMFKDGVLD